MEDEVEQIGRQIKRLEDTQLDNIGISETRHRELMDYMLTLKMESDKRHESIKYLLYIIIMALVFVVFKIR